MKPEEILEYLQKKHQRGAEWAAVNLREELDTVRAILNAEAELLEQEAPPTYAQAIDLSHLLEAVKQHLKWAAEHNQKAREHYRQAQELKNAQQKAQEGAQK